jgi:hypothetical protein
MPLIKSSWSLTRPIELMLSSASKFPVNNRRNIYQTASNRLMGEGNWQAARDVLAENFADEDRDQMLANFDSNLGLQPHRPVEIYRG